MPVLEAVILDGGKAAISSALIGLDGSAPHSFIVGTEAGGTLDSTIVAVTGEEVFEGGTGSISVSRLSEDTVRYICTISEAEGPFQVGNLLLNLSNLEDGVVPFVHVILPVAITKKQADPTVTTEGYQVPGSRLSFNIEVTHSKDAEIVSVTVVTPTYSTLPMFATEADVPNGAALTYRNFVIQYDTRTKTPVLGTVDQNNIRWGMPYSRNVSDPAFGHLDGGQDGEGYGGEVDEFIPGLSYIYLRIDSDFDEPDIGGVPYTATALPDTIGGASYTATTNVSTNSPI